MHVIGCDNCLTTTYVKEVDVVILAGVGIIPKSPYVGAKNSLVLIVKTLLSNNKVVLNFNSPNTPGYTIFENSDTNLYTREKLFDHLMILLGGRIAEELFYGLSVTTGAQNDFSEALKLANKMIVYYGMGKLIVYPSTSEKYKEILDEEVAELICHAFKTVSFILRNCKDLINECAIILKDTKILKYDDIYEIIITKYIDILKLKI